MEKVYYDSKVEYNYAEECYCVTVNNSSIITDYYDSLAEAEFYCKKIKEYGYSMDF